MKTRFVENKGNLATKTKDCNPMGGIKHIFLTINKQGISEGFVEIMWHPIWDKLPTNTATKFTLWGPHLRSHERCLEESCNNVLRNSHRKYICAIFQHLWCLQNKKYTEDRGRLSSRGMMQRNKRTDNGFSNISGRNAPTLHTNYLESV